MVKKLLCFVGILLASQIAFAQKDADSVTVSLKPVYDSVSKIHRKLFGENYRKEWATPCKLPVIKISEIKGGLNPIELGGGHQSHSLRLEDKTGKKWVLRSVQKYSEGLAPDLIKGSVYEKWVDDNFSAQHPYSALIVPVLADAVKVPHTNPIIGWVAPDKSLKEFNAEFGGSICLLEEREPRGKSDNTPKMLNELDEDNDNRLDSAVFFRARLLDLLIADWGRHEDQWRWVDTRPGSGKDYLVIPRDRDQALYLNEGILPHAAASISMLSFLEGFNASYKDPNAFFINGRKLNQQFLNQYTYDEWIRMTRDFVTALPDEVLRKAVNAMPAASVRLQGDKIFSKLRSRRDGMLSAMDSYYRFLYKIVDVRTSDKNELIEFTETGNGKVRLDIHKLSASGKQEKMLFSNVFDPSLTQQIRLFEGKGKDVIRVNVPSGKIKIRLIGGEGSKNYEIEQAKLKVSVYENGDDDRFSGPHQELIKHISDDTLNIHKVFSNLYLGSGKAPAVDLRSMDGVFLGISYKITKEGFHKDPFGSVQQITALHSLSTPAFILKYGAEWKNIFRNSDLTVNALADMKGNILNFFGRGNETGIDQTGDFRRYYKVNFSFYKLDPALRFTLSKNLTITAGPSFQYYANGSNEGRYIIDPVILNSFNTLIADKVHAGLLFNFTWDNRDQVMLPAKGLHFNVLLQGYEGLNTSSNAFAQAFSQLAFYKSLDSKGNIVLANRIGGGVTAGETAFYQSAFLGSQDNLLGFRKYRFAGDHLLYNNLEARINLPNFLHYVLPGKVGLIGFYDAGRVWIKNETSDTIHQGIGGGIFLAPFNRLLIRAIAGYSEEGWQPTIALKQRF